MTQQEQGRSVLGQASDSHSQHPPGRQYPPDRTAIYALGVIMVATFTALLDRFLIGILLEPIQQDLLINDTQASLLQGLAFAVFYSLLGIPFGRWVDSGNRRNILALGVFVWSLTTVLCGFAATYNQLFIARLGVGIGEACLAPAAYSLITDLFRPDRHGRALASYTLSSIVGGGASFVLGAKTLGFATWLSANFEPTFGVAPWRLTFMIIGAPGILVALLLLTFSEPIRHGSDDALGKPGLRELAAFLKTIRRPFFLLIGAGVTASVTGTGVASWLVVFLSRTYGVAPETGGQWIGPTIIATGILGGVISGSLMDSARIRAMVGRKANVLLLGSLAMIPFSATFPLSDSPIKAMMLFACSAFAFNIHACALPATLQDMLPNRMKGQISALYWLCVGLLGLGMASPIVALLTDNVFADPAKLRYSMVVAGVGGMTLSFLFVLGSRKSYQACLDRAGAARFSSTR